MRQTAKRANEHRFPFGDLADAAARDTKVMSTPDGKPIVLLKKRLGPPY